MGTFAEWVAELGQLHTQVNSLEEQLKEIQNVMSTLLKEKAEGETTVTTSGGVEDISSVDLSDVAISARTTARAIYQYSMLASSLGLSKDIKKQIKEIQEISMMVMNLTRAYILLDMAMSATGDPMAIIGLIAGGGALAASLGYSIKLSGGR